MARGSYLARIAEPVRSGEPVVWSVPRPLAEEARPPAAERKTRPGRSEKRPTQTAGPPAQAPPPSPAELAGHPASARPREEPAARASLSSPDPARAAAPRETIRAVTEDPAGRADHAIRAPASHSPLPEGPEKPSAERPALSASRDEAGREAVGPPIDIAPTRPRSAPAAVGEPAAPRLHIGTIEIRAAESAPPAPVRAPPSAPAPRLAAPIARAHPWRYGLVQG